MSQGPYNFQEGCYIGQIDFVRDVRIAYVAFNLTILNSEFGKNTREAYGSVNRFFVFVSYLKSFLYFQSLMLLSELLSEDRGIDRTRRPSSKLLLISVFGPTSSVLMEEGPLKHLCALIFLVESFH